MVESADVAAQLQALQQEFDRLRIETAAFRAGAAAGAASSSRAEETEERPEHDPGPYAPYYSDSNPHAPRPLNISDTPQLYALEHSATYRELEGRQGSSLRYEFRTLEPVLSYLYDVKAELDWVVPASLQNLLGQRSQTVEALPTAVTPADQKIDELCGHLLGIKNSIYGCYTILNQRSDYIKLKTKFESNPRGITAAERGLLNYLETKFYGFADGLTVVDGDMQKWITSFSEKAASAILLQAAKSSAKGGGKGKGKGGKGKGKGKGEPEA